MGLNIKNAEVERLAAEAAKRFGETKTEAIRVALMERLKKAEPRLSPKEKHRRLMLVLENEVWPNMPPEVLDRPPMTKEEWEEALGYGPGEF